MEAPTEPQGVFSKYIELLQERQDEKGILDPFYSIPL